RRRPAGRWARRPGSSRTPSGGTRPGRGGRRTPGIVGGGARAMGRGAGRWRPGRRGRGGGGRGRRRGRGDRIGPRWFEAGAGGRPWRTDDPGTPPEDGVVVDL